MDEKELKPEELESVDGGTNKFGPLPAGRPAGLGTVGLVTVEPVAVEREEGRQLTPEHPQR